MVFSVLCGKLASLDFSLFRVHVTAAASAVPLARGVRYLDRFSAYGPLYGRDA